MDTTRENPTDGAVSAQPCDEHEVQLLRDLFDPAFYLDRNPDVKASGVEPFLHFLQHGSAEGRCPHPLFDAAYYLAHQPGAAESGLHPLLHFVRIGVHAGANPHPLVDTVFYFSRYPDVAEKGLNPLVDFLQHGARESRDPHPGFNSAAYLSANPDVAASGVNPLVHYVLFGKAEGRPIYRVSDRFAPSSLQLELLRWRLATARMQVAKLDYGLAAGKLVVCHDPMYMGRVYYCLENRRHWVVPSDPSVPGVPSPEYLACYGLSRDELVAVSGEEIQRYTLAGPLPLLWSEEEWLKPIRSSSFDLRQIAASRLRGSGIEFGAGTGPMALPLNCRVKYADLFSEGDLNARAYQAQGKDFVHLDYEMGMEDMSQIANGSLDFVVACHVIEHLRNPLRAFEQVYRKLKPGGMYVLIVPEMRLTFDRDRVLTPLDHLLADFREPSRERDVPHYFEFFSKVYAVPDAGLADRVQAAIAANDDLHFHTWTYESFGEMVQYIRQQIAPWSSVWSQPAIWEDPGCHEFYFVLTR